MASSAPPRTSRVTGSGIPWWPGARQSGRESGRFDRDQITAAALRILDEEGYDALSMRRLATTLDAGTMTVYWHFATKDELLAHVVDLVMSPAATATPDPGTHWVSQLRECAWNMRRALVEHPEVGRIILQGVTAGPALVRMQETVLAILRAAGFDARTSVDAFYAFGLVVTGAPMNPVPGRTESTALERDRWNAGHSQRDLDRATYPTIVELADVLELPPDDSRFEFALETILAGLERRHAPHDRTPT